MAGIEDGIETCVSCGNDFATVSGITLSGSTANMQGNEIDKAIQEAYYPGYQGGLHKHLQTPGNMGSAPKNG